MNAAELSKRLASQADMIAQMLLPSGKREGAEWVAGSTNGESGKSLKVRLTGEKVGVWADFANPGTGGDLLDLWASAKGITFSEAYREACQWLGVSEPKFEQIQRKAFQRPAKPDCHSPKGRVLEYLTEQRKLSAASLKAYRVAESPDENEIIFPFLRDGELLNCKRLKVDRVDGKKVMSQSKDAEPCLFGWQAIPDSARVVTICEGEIDAISLHQYGFPALSVNSGANNFQWIETDFQRLERFAEIFLCFDGDEPGQKAVKEAASRLGLERCRIVNLPHKDANECLQNGVLPELIKKAFEEASSSDPTELRSAGTYVEETIAEFYGDKGNKSGAVFPWRKTWQNVRLRNAELSIWTGINSHGKSQVLGHCMLEMAKQSEKICVFSGEMKPRRLLYRLTRQASALEEPSIPYIRAIHKWLDGKFWLFDVVGTAKTQRILEVFKYASKRYGVTHFVIDSLMKCGIAEDDYRAQKEFVDALADFKNEFDCHVHLVAHARKGPDDSKPADKMDVKGTGAITDLADNVFSVWKNVKKEEGKGEEDDADGILYCKKQRNGEWEGLIPLWFHKPSFQYLEGSELRPVSYVPFSIQEVPSVAI